jgi:hypothetical protein
VLKLLYDHQTIVVAREGRTCSEIADDLFREAVAMYSSKKKLATMVSIQELPEGRAGVHIVIREVLSDKKVYDKYGPITVFILLMIIGIGVLMYFR